MAAEPKRPPRPLEQEARDFAIEAHANAGVRYGEHPFEFHLDSVARTLIRFGHDEFGLSAAAYLHDVVEDTPVSIGDIGEQFGSVIRDLVDAVTDVKFAADGTLLGNRHERHLLTYAKLRVIALRHGDMVVNLKLADRIANVEETIRTRSAHLGMYHGEHEFFSEQVKPAGGDPAMWFALDALVDALPPLIEQEKARKKDERQARHRARMAASAERKALL